MNVSQVALWFLLLIGGGYLIIKFGRALGGLLVVLCLVAIGVFVLVHSFQAFSDRVLAATVKASPVANQPHEMTVDITTYSQDGTPTETSYEIGGDRWQLQTETVEFQPWVLVLGIKSGYQLSRLDSQYDDPNANTSHPVSLGSWSWFASLENNVGLFSPIIKSAYGSGVVESADGRSYSVFVDSAGDLSANRV